MPDRQQPLQPGRIDMTAVPGEPELTLVRGMVPQPIVLTSTTATHGWGYTPSLVALPISLTPGSAAELSTALALAVAHYDVPRARAIANRIDAVLEAEAEGRRIPLGTGLVRGWFETPIGTRNTTRRRP